MAKEYLVRLRPRPAKPRKGVANTPARYMIRGVRFEESKGWYKVPDPAFAEELRELTHNGREDGVRIFDVCTPKEAAAIQAKERRSKVRRDVEDAEVQTVTPTARARARRSAVSMDDVRPEGGDEELTQPPEMIDGADLDDADLDDDDLDEEGDEDLDADALGRLEGGLEQELDDGDDLLDGEREPEAPKIRQTAQSQAPQTRKKSASKKGSSKKSASKK